jgi:hypothetical protein
MRPDKVVMCRAFGRKVPPLAPRGKYVEYVPLTTERREILRSGGRNGSISAYFW